MAVLHRHRHPGFWTPQRVPTEAVEVDQSHPLANGLTSAYVLGQLKDAAGASGPASIAGGATLGSSPMGLAGVFTATAGPLISVPDVPALNLVSAGTVCAWVTFDVLSSRVIFIGKGLGNNQTDTSYWLEKNAANNPVSYFASAGTDHVLTGSSSTISDHNTHFICATYDGAKQSVYLDGVADPATASWSATIAANTNPLRFGNGLTSSFNLNLGGSISLFLLYNRCLPATEVAQLNAEPFAVLRPIARRTYGISTTPSTAATVIGAAGVGSAGVLGDGLLSALTGTNGIGAAGTPHGQDQTAISGAAGTTIAGLLVPAAGAPPVGTTGAGTAGNVGTLTGNIGIIIGAAASAVSGSLHAAVLAANAGIAAVGLVGLLGIGQAPRALTATGSSRGFSAASSLSLVVAPPAPPPGKVWPVEDGRDVLVPGVGRSVVVPLLGNRPALGAPSFFDAMDPTDVDVFAYDWSVIGFPGDQIVAASITADPPLLTIGQIILVGDVIQVFLGPVTGSCTTLDINCSVTFATGRVLDWGCEISVQTL